MTTLLDIARGLDSKLLVRRVSGKCGTADTVDGDLATCREAAGGVSDVFWPTVAEIVTVVSSSASDTPAGTGARSVRVSGLDLDWNEIEEVIATNGLTPVNGTKLFLRVNQTKVESAGAVRTNVGRLLLSQATAGSIDAILSGAGVSHPGRYSIPAGRRAYLISAHAEAGAAALVRLLNRIGAVNVEALPPKTAADWDRRYALAQRFDAKTDLVLRGAAASGTAAITAELELLLEVI